MKITDIKVLPANSFLFVKVMTDEGIYGIGEGAYWGFLMSTAEAVESFKTYLIGQDPLQIEHHWQYMYRCYHFRGADIMSAISAIDMALWDIAGKYFGVPVYKLLGGPTRKKVRVYTQVTGETTKELVAECVKAKEAGFTAVGKLSPFGDVARTVPYFKTYAELIDGGVDTIRQIREAVGNDLDLLIELHCKLKPGEAIDFSNKVAKYNPMFIEDPIVPDSFDDMALVAKRCTVPMATGERLHTIQEFMMLYNKQAVVYARADIGLCGGFTGAKKIAAIAEANGGMLVPHTPCSPVLTAATLQFDAAVENIAIQEFPNHNDVAATERFNRQGKIETKFTQADLVTWMPTVENGFALIPDTPGIGCDLVEDVEKKFPFKRRKIVTRLHVDGSIVDQ